MEFGVCKKFCNHLFFLFATVFASETSEIFRKTRNAIFAKKDDPTKASCQGTKNFAAWQKIVGLQMFSTASLKFGGGWIKFWSVKNKSFALEMASCDIFFAKQTKFSVLRTGSKSRLTVTVTRLHKALLSRVLLDKVDQSIGRRVVWRDCTRFLKFWLNCLSKLLA